MTSRFPKLVSSNSSISINEDVNEIDLTSSTSYLIAEV